MLLLCVGEESAKTKVHSDLGPLEEDSDDPVPRVHRRSAGMRPCRERNKPQVLSDHHAVIEARRRVTNGGPEAVGRFQHSDGFSGRWLQCREEAEEHQVGEDVYRGRWSFQHAAFVI